MEIMWYGLLVVFLVAIAIFCVQVHEMANSKKCPHCAGRIEKATSVCRFCGRDLPPLQIHHI
jgi:hypothetical protein